MSINSNLDDRRRRTMVIVIVYPIGVMLAAVILNFFVFGVTPFTPAIPSLDTIYALIAAAVILTVNHTWIMTATELKRIRYRMYATPEEWKAGGRNREDVSKEGLQELERVHNAHRNTTENTVYFSLLSLILIFATPTAMAALVWPVGFAIARLGYTYSYLKGKDSARGLFMTLSLLAMYGIAGYLLLSIII